MKHVARVDAARWSASGLSPVLPSLDRALAVVVRGAVEPGTCRDWARAVIRARRDWVADFGREQFALGRAFYTHLETGRAGLYFQDAAESDARVERHLPGMQSSVLELFARMVGGHVRRRHGFCGPGVHVFPAREKVARSGGVIHFDTEGLTPHQLARGASALSLIVMLQPPEWGGGLRVWDARWEGADQPTDDALESDAVTIRYGVGDAVLMDSRRLHQIRPFRGKYPRISITMHAAEIDRAVWEGWF